MINPTGLVWGIVRDAHFRFAHRVNGMTHRVVDCQECRRRFEYDLECEAICSDRDVVGWTLAHSKRRAEAKALRQIQELLESARGLYPCPGCGHYQSDMIEEYRQSRHRDQFREARNLFLIASFVMLLGVFGILFGYNNLLAQLAILAGLFMNLLAAYLWNAVNRKRQAIQPHEWVDESTRIQFAMTTGKIGMTPAPELCPNGTE